MAFFDPFELAGSLVEIVRARRFLLPFAIGIGIAVGVYYLAEETPASAAVAFVIGAVGFCTGIVLHLAGDKSHSI